MTTDQIATCLKTTAICAVSSGHVKADDLPFDPRNAEKSEQFHNWVDLVEQAMLDTMHNMCIAAIHHGGL